VFTQAPADHSTATIRTCCRGIKT